MTTNQQTLALDHVVLVVTNLKRAIAQFQSNGFTVVEGAPMDRHTMRLLRLPMVPT